MAGEWREVRLGEVVSINPDSIGTDWHFSHIKYIDISSVGEGAIVQQPQTLSVNEAPSRAKRLVREGDSILSTVRPGRRSMLFVKHPGPDWVVSTGFAVLRPRREYVEPRYLYACIFDKAFTEFLVKREKGAAYPAVLPEDIADAVIKLPPLPEQRAIAHILGTLDDKIELNRRMSETLEAMARALFKSWFIDFEPVRAKMEGCWQRGQSLPGLPAHLYDLFPARLVDSELGEIPEGWRVGRLGEYMVNFDSKRVPLSGADRANRRGAFPYYGAAGVIDYIDDYLFDGIYLLVGEDGSVIDDSGLGVTQYVWGKLWVNNHAHVLQGKNAVSTEQLYLYFHFEPVAPYVTGAVQPKLSQGRMNMMPFVYAGENVCRAFHQIVTNWFAKLRLCAEETRTLSALRDALLPKLISGELRVKDAEQFLKKRGL